MIDPNSIGGRKRSSLKQHNLFPDNMTYDEFVALQKGKNIKWDNHVEVKVDDVKEENPTEKMY
jgi:hypothetical protein